MLKRIIFFSILILVNAQLLFADTGSAESGSGTLTSLPPSAPALSSPADGATGVLSSELTWNANTHTSSYNLQVSEFSDFSTTITDESGLIETSYAIPNLSGEITYYWHVSGTNVMGEGTYSDTWDFTTDPAILVTLSSFSAQNVNSGILVKWSTASEINVVGFILDRTTLQKSQKKWEIVASYQTDDALIGKGGISTHADYQFTDTKVTPGCTYQYRLNEVCTDGNVTIYDVLEIEFPIVSSIEQTSTSVAELTTLKTPFPNPFNPQTKISYTLLEPGYTNISVFDLRGRKVISLLNAHKSPGSHNLYWYGQDDYGNQMASGAYLIVLKTKEIVKKQKVILLH